MESNLWLAAYAALVGTLSLFWNVYVALRDRANVKVGIERMNLCIGGEWINNMIAFTAANRGRRPVILSSCRMEFSNGKVSAMLPFPTYPLPRKLEEGENYETYHSLRTAQEAVQAHPKGVRVTAIVFKSADGRTFRHRLWPWSVWHKVFRADLFPEPPNIGLLDPTRPLRDTLASMRSGR